MIYNIRHRYFHKHLFSSVACLKNKARVAVCEQYTADIRKRVAEQIRDIAKGAAEIREMEAALHKDGYRECIVCEEWNPRKMEGSGYCCRCREKYTYVCSVKCQRVLWEAWHRDRCVPRRGDEK